MIICMFGTYAQSSTRVQILKRGLPTCGTEVVEVNLDLPFEKLDNERHMNPLRLISRVLRKLKFIPVLLKNLPAIRRADVLYVTFPGHLDLPLAWLTARIFGKRLVFDPMFALYSMVTSDLLLVKPHSIIARIIVAIERILYHLPDLIIADTPFQKAFYSKLFGLPVTRIAVVPIGANDAVYPHTPYRRPNKPINITYYGLYNPMHGVEYIIKAADLLKHKKEIHFTMIGNGQTYATARKQADTLGLPNMTFYPDIREQDALPLLQTADIFMGFLADLPAVTRHIPNKVYQGLALGKAVLTARGEAIESIFKDRQDLYLVPPADAGALAKAIQDIVDHPRLHHTLSENGYRQYQRSFTPAAVAHTFLSAIHLIP